MQQALGRGCTGALGWIWRPGTGLAEPSVRGHNEQNVPSEKSFMGKIGKFLLFVHALLWFEQYHSGAMAV